MEECEQLAETDTSPVTVEQSPRTANETSENESTSMLGSFGKNWHQCTTTVKLHNCTGMGLYSTPTQILTYN